MMENTQNGCSLCPRLCGADRAGGKRGFCGAGNTVRIARAALHFWEEPCISGTEGSGTVFFSGCQLKCCFCQNYKISHECFGKDITEERLSAVFLSLQEQGANNINLVSATPYTDAVLRVLDHIRGKELHIPVVWNSGGYERVDTLKRLEGYVDIYLPDVKYDDSARAAAYSGAADYPMTAYTAVSEMARQTGKPAYDARGMMTRGTIVRHLVMPGGRRDSIAVIRRLRELFSPDEIVLSLMSQYTPFYKSCEHKEINRRVTTFEYESVCNVVTECGFDGFFKKRALQKKNTRRRLILRASESF